MMQTIQIDQKFYFLEQNIPERDSNLVTNSDNINVYAAEVVTCR